MKTFPHTAELMKQIIEQHGKEEFLRVIPEVSPQFLRNLLTGAKALPAPIAFKIAREFSMHQMKFVHAHLEDCREYYMSRGAA
jgi:hypothetical protein